jgi:hypothetical protein
MKTNNKNLPASLHAILDSLGFNNGVFYVESDVSPITECAVSVFYNGSSFGKNNPGLVAEISLDRTKIQKQLNSDKQTREAQLINIVESAKMAAEFARKESATIDGYFGIRTQSQPRKFCHSIKTGTVEIFFLPDIDNMCKFRIATNMLLGGKPFAVVNCANTSSAVHAAKVMLATLLPNAEEIGFIQQMVANANHIAENASQVSLFVADEKREENPTDDKENRSEEKSNEE